MMYYILDCEIPENENGEALMEVHNCFEVGDVWNWRDGLPMEPDEKDVPEPVLVGYDTYRGYKGAPIPLVDVCIPLMSKPLVEALKEIGVANLELFSAVLTNNQTAEKHDYYAYKLVGVVAAADLNKSDWTSYDSKPISGTSFKSLALDTDKAEASGLLMFRLEENINALMVHEKVRDHLVARGFDNLKFIKPEDWVQL